jgi:hypothetical protein
MKSTYVQSFRQSTSRLLFRNVPVFTGCSTLDPKQLHFLPLDVVCRSASTPINLMLIDTALEQRLQVELDWEYRLSISFSFRFSREWEESVYLEFHLFALLLLQVQLGRSWPFSALDPFAAVMPGALASTLGIGVGDYFVLALVLQVSNTPTATLRREMYCMSCRNLSSMIDGC